jgi:hypothetical protein
MENKAIIVSHKVVNYFYCEKCDYKCSRKYDYNKHLMTSKHTVEIYGTGGNGKVVDNYKCNTCNKQFKTNSGLWKHKKKCGIVQGESESLIATTNHIASAVDIEKITELFKHMLTQNQDFMSDIVEKVIPKIGNTTNNTNTNSHNTTNNQFNIQMFLNEHCKNAMNLTDFVQSLPITSETYDSTIENGLTKTITNMMLNGLNELDILERPIHCTDASRKTLYVKESDTWEKDNELLHVINSIKYLSIKHRGMIKTWKEANEGWQTKDKLQSRMTTLIIHSMKLIERDAKETSKIIRSISKNVYLNDETKKLYT